MRASHLLPVAALLIALPAAAQSGSAPADTIHFGDGAGGTGSDSIRMADAGTPVRPAARVVGHAGTDGRGDALRGPFAVETTGRVASRPPRPPAVTSGAGSPPRVAARDTAAPPAPADTAARTTPATPPRRAPTAAPAATTPTSPAAGAERARTHRVEAGDTFFGIARRYGVTPAQLRAVNPGVDPEVLEVGDLLQLPAAARADGTAAPPPPSTPAPTPTSTPAREPAGAAQVHVVVPGETLFGLSRRYGVSMDAIRDANGMDTDQVNVGQRLTIPPDR